MSGEDVGKVRGRGKRKGSEERKRSFVFGDLSTHDETFVVTISGEEKNLVPCLYTVYTIHQELSNKPNYQCQVFPVKYCFYQIFDQVSKVCEVDFVAAI